jgi:hypothetical protein
MPAEKRKGDRGGGIHVSQGMSFRIRDFKLSFDGTTGDLVDSSMITELRADTFHHWLQIAADARESAEAARVSAMEAERDDNATFNEALEREFRASLTAIAAAAFAIDAFYASVLEHAPDTRVAADSRDAKIFESLKRAFQLSEAQRQALREPLRVIFRLRDEAVHPPAAWVEPVLHPIFNVGMETRFINYRVENANNAQLLAHKLIHVCLRNPKPTYTDLAEWCEALKAWVPEPPPLPSEDGSTS